MTKPASPTSFGFTDACEIAVAPYTPAKPRVTFTVKPPGGPDPFTAEEWADYDSGRLPSCAEEMSPGLRERHVRRALRNRDGM